MHVIAIDPNPYELAELVVCIQAVHPGSRIGAFSDPLLAVKYGLNDKPDSLYTVIDMNRLNGFETARMLKVKFPNLLVNFITGSDHLRRDALRFGMNSYVVLPLTPERMREAEDEAWADEENEE